MRYTQPQSGPLRIDPANPLAISELFVPVSRRTVVRGYDTTVSAGVVSDIAGPPGRGIAFDVTQNNGLVIASRPDMVFSSLTECTVFVFRRSKDTTARASYLFGYDNGSTDRVLAHAPYSDGSLYWDFGATGPSNRLSVPFAKSTSPETLVFVAGSVKGREVWRNGVKIAANSAATGTRANNTTFPVRIGTAINLAGFTSDNEEIYLFGIASRAWSDAEIKAWSTNPWQLFGTPQRIYATTAGGPLTYSYTAAGGFVVAGTSPAVRGLVKTTIGGLSLSGTTPAIRGAIKAPTGGLNLSGSATTLRGRVLAGLGGMSFSGAASLVFTSAVQSLTVTPVGGMIIRGTATMVRTVVRAVSGGITFAGHAATTLTPDPNPPTTHAFKRGRRPRTRKNY